MPFSDIILGWYDRNKRELPWRGTTDPYTVWLSEIILQQTRVVQGTPYFLNFISQYPTVSDLALAPEQEVLKLWQGLGYYSRARNLLHTARHVAGPLNGQFPDTYKGLLALKGVGPYTAAAIASVCFGRAHAVVDGNVYRVLSRYFGVDTPVNTSEGIRAFSDLAQSLMVERRPGDYNQALMEFGAVQCTPAAPDCANCPLAGGCRAREEGNVFAYPVKRKGKPARRRRLHYLIPVDPEGNTFMRQRTGSGIWQGLYEFPLLEANVEPETEDAQACLAAALNDPALVVTGLQICNPHPVVHKLSHQHLITTFWRVEVERILEGAVDLEQAEALPVPVLISNFLETAKNSYF